MKARGTIVGLLGVWLIVAAFLPLPAVIEIWSNLITGVLVALLGFSLGAYTQDRHWIAGIAGLWTIVSAFIPGLHSGAGLLINNIACGGVIMITGFSVPATSDRRESERRAA